ncbi:MAG TPA: DUF4388 domain-containing protein [Pyrinomonadaceae bacterium]|jgi:curved DNA-binding protein CbpA|nr:DUF4388 domain-containing protein [Pyrinomonadaceae bacterium]
MNGQLSDHPLAELISEISNARLSGALRLACERVKGVVYFDGGRIVAAHTNLRSYRLVEVLRRAGVFAPDEFAAVVKEGMSDEEAGAAILASGALTPEGLSKHRERQTEEVLRLLANWADGEWIFDPRVRLHEGAGAGLDARQILIESARQLPPEFASRRMADADALVTPAENAQGFDDGLELLPTEGFVLSRVFAPTPLGELVAVSGLPEQEAQRALYALTLGGLLHCQHWPRAFSPEALARAQAHAAAAAKAAAAQQADGSPKESAAVGQPPAAAEEKDAAPVETETDPLAELDELFSRAEAATHYSMLGVPRSAQSGEVKRAYYALAKRFHPDRFRRVADDSLRPRIEFAFGKIAQAYEVLKDARTRAAYDLKLDTAAKRAAAPNPPAATGQEAEATRDVADRQQPADATPTDARKSSPQYRAEERFQQGLAALQQKNTALAAQYLGEAALLVPNQPRYRAYYGRALAQERRTRRQAETELQAAIRLDARNISYRVMLAELYVEIGMHRRAEGELERALALDPKHEAALRMLKELRPGG